MIDLKQPYTEAVNNLLTWRKRYSSYEYPEKVALNIFYRKYTMDFLWNSARNLKFDSFEDGVYTLKRKYGELALSKVQPILMDELKNNPTRVVGNVAYSGFPLMFEKIRNGDLKLKEELDYSYLFFLLSDECVLYWMALCGSGVGEMDAITKLSSYVIEDVPNIDYSIASSVLGQLCAGQYLSNHYSPF